MGGRGAAAVLAAIAAAFCPTAFAGAAPPKAALIGRTVPPFPPELPDLGGSCFSAPAGASADPAASAICAYAFSAHGPDWPRLSHVLVLKAIGHEGNQTQWRVLDVLERPTQPPGRMLAFHGCLRDGRDAPALLAWVDAEGEGEWYEPVYRAWEFDFARERLREIPPAGVRCVNEGHGYDG